MEQSKQNNEINENCFICNEKAIDTCTFCAAGIAYCGDGHMKIHSSFSSARTVYNVS